MGLASAGSSSQRSAVDGVVSRVPSPWYLGGARTVSLLPAGKLCATALQPYSKREWGEESDSVCARGPRLAAPATDDVARAPAHERA